MGTTCTYSLNYCLEGYSLVPSLSNPQILQYESDKAWGGKPGNEASRLDLGERGGGDVWLLSQGFVPRPQMVDCDIVILYIELIPFHCSAHENLATMLHDLRTKEAEQCLIRRQLGLC